MPKYRAGSPITDIRIHTGILRNAKVRMLQLKLGDGAVLSLIRLWCYAAEHRTKGVFQPDEDIELVSEWTGTPGEFRKTLLLLRLADTADDEISIHNWDKRNRWIYFHEERSKAGREYAMRRWQHLHSSPDAVKTPDDINSPELEHFRKLWEKYPRKTNAQAAIDNYLLSVKTDEDRKDIESALERYSVAARSLIADGKERFIKNGDGFFNGDFWRGWIKTTPPKRKERSTFVTHPEAVSEAEQANMAGKLHQLVTDLGREKAL